MKIPTTLLLLLPVFAAAQTQSLEESKPAAVERVPAHTPEWTNPNTGDPGTTDSTVPELQRIVVLCATAPQSAEFEGQWTAYVRKHYKPGMNVDAVIDGVMQRAAAYRAEKSRRARIGKPAVSDTATRRLMHDAAMLSVRNMK